jgi:predicted RecB family nuclease
MAININKALDKAYESKSLKELVNMPLAGFAGLTDESAKHLEALGVRTVRDLAEWRFVLWAQAIVTLAKTEE